MDPGFHDHCCRSGRWRFVDRLAYLQAGAGSRGLTACAFHLAAAWAVLVVGAARRQFQHRPCRNHCVVRDHDDVRLDLPRHSICLKCFRKRWPNGKYSSYQTPPRFRTWEICCFCPKKHKDGLHKPREPRNSELRCGGNHGDSKLSAPRSTSKRATGSP